MINILTVIYIIADFIFIFQKIMPSIKSMGYENETLAMTESDNQSSIYSPRMAKFKLFFNTLPQSVYFSLHHPSPNFFVMTTQ